MAVVGASDDPRKWGNWLARAALLGAHRREVMLVNRRTATVLGRPTHPSLGELPTPPELVVLAVPAAAFEETVDQALEIGARAILAITAGLAETGPAGVAAEAAAVARVRQAGAVLLGPNCLGVMDAASELRLTSNELPSGPIGLISQSGNLALEIGARAADAGLGFARFASIGNQADLDVADLVADFAASGVEAIALYCEDFRRGRSFLEAALEASSAGVPVALITVAGGGAAARAARSHTGALVSGAGALGAACRAAGIEQVSTPRELVALLQGLLMRQSPGGSRVAVLADGGGHGAVAAGLAEAQGLSVPALPAELSGRLAAATGTGGGTSNPVDLAGAGEQDLWSFTRVVDALLGADEVDSVLMSGFFGGYGDYGEGLRATELEVASGLGELMAEHAKPLLVHSMIAASSDPGSPLGRLRSSRVPVYRDVEAAVWVAARLAERAARRAARLPPLRRELAGPGDAGYFAARELLGAAGFPFLPAHRVHDRLEALRAAEDLGWPVAVKAVSLEHKSDSGGVVLGVGDAATLEQVVDDLWARLGPGPLSVERMADPAGGVELIAGCVRDPRFGPVALVGLGGVHAEVLVDVASGLAPLDEEEAEELLGSLRGARLLGGARGRARLDLAAAALAVSVLSEVAASHPQVSELEVNPLLVTTSGAYGLDARLALGTSGSDSPLAARTSPDPPASAEPASCAGTGRGGGTP